MKGLLISAAVYGVDCLTGKSIIIVLRLLFHKVFCIFNKENTLWQKVQPVIQSKSIEDIDNEFLIDSPVNIIKDAVPCNLFKVYTMHS